MAQTIDANLQATLKVVTDFNEAEEGLNDLVQYTAEIGEQIEETLSESLIEPIRTAQTEIDRYRDQLDRIEELVDPTRAPQPAPMEGTMRAILERVPPEQREQIEEQFGITLGGGGTVGVQRELPTGRREVPTRELFEEAVRETTPPAAREEIERRPRRSIEERRIETRGTLDVNLNVTVTGTTGAAELVKDIFKQREFEDEFVYRVNRLIEKKKPRGE